MRAHVYPPPLLGPTAQTFKGIIDEVEVYNRALSASEIQAIFAAGSAGKCKPGAGLAHFLCYEAKTAEEEPEFERRDVDLEDQFGATTKTVKKPKLLCTPVVKDAEGVVDLQDSEGHLVCYEVKGQDEFEKRDVLVFNQFEDEEEGRILTVKKPRILCVPSEKVEVFEVEDDDDEDDEDDDGDDDEDDEEEDDDD